jgi:folate-binding protein YgfZ
MPGIGDQYRTIDAGAGWRRRAERGRLRFGGNDRAAFLHALLTNDVAALVPGRGSYGALLTPQGRMIADFHLFARPDHIVADVPAGAAPSLSAELDRLIFAEDATVADVSAAVAQLNVTGGRAAAIVAHALGLAERALRGLEAGSQIDFAEGFVARTDETVLPGYDLLIPAVQEATTIESLSDAGAAVMTEELFTALRVDAGRPLFGVDMNADTIPLEAGLLDRAISTTKGCYVGQEVIIRVLHRGGGRVARRLVKIKFDGEASGSLRPGAGLRIGDRQAGHITSLASALDDSGSVALGYLRREFAETGQTVVADGPSSVEGVVTGFAG